MTTEDGMPYVPYSIELPEDPPWQRNEIALRVEKIAAWVPMSRQLAEDFLMINGRHGVRHEQVDPTGVWRERWLERASTLSVACSGSWFPFDHAPPYEHMDTVKPPTFHPFPRLDALEARIRPKVAETRRRLRNALDALKGSEPESDYW